MPSICIHPAKSLFSSCKLLYLDIVNLGLADITVSFPIRYIADRSLVGLCGEGGYYVEGGIK